MKLINQNKQFATIVTRAKTFTFIYNKLKLIKYMESDLSNIHKEIQYIEFLFQNKQIDQFVNRVEKYILPYLNKQQHLISDHLLQKQQTHHKQQQQKLKQTKIIKQQKTVKHVESAANKQKLVAELNISEQHNKQLKKKQQTQVINNAQGQDLNLVKEDIHKKQKKEEQIIHAYSEKQKLQDKLTQQKNKSQEIANAIKKSKIHILQKYEEMKLVLFKIQRQMKKLQTPMVDKGQWKINKINSSSVIGVKTKGTLVQIRYQGIVQTNIFNLCVMIYLSQLWKQWVPFCSNSKTVAEPSPLQKIVLMDLKIPLVTQRYSYLHGIAVDRITKTGKLYIYAEGITHQKDLLTQVHKADKAQYERKVAKSVVLDAKFMVAEIGNQGGGKYSVKVYGMIDSHMPLLPQKVVNYIVKQLGGLIFQKIVKKAKDIKNTPWQKQLQQNETRQVKNYFYDWLKQRIANWDKTQVARKSKI